MDISGTIEYTVNRGANTMKLDDCPTGNHKFTDDQTKLEEIHRFIGDTKWCPREKLDEKDNTSGTTWIELLIMYEVLGYDKEPCKPKTVRLDTPHNKKEKDRIERWRTFSGMRTQKIKAPIARAISEDSTSMILEQI